MPRRPGAVPPPASHFDGGFPDGTLHADAPPGAAEIAHVATALRHAIEDSGTSISQLARDTGVDRTTIHDLLSGRAYVDTVTLARLETGVGVGLWPPRGH